MLHIVMRASVALLRLRHRLLLSRHCPFTSLLPRHQCGLHAHLSSRMIHQSSSSQLPQLKLGVAVTMLRHSGGEVQCLLIKRGKEPMRGHWALPGGGVEPGESIAQAAVREVSSSSSSNTAQRSRQRSSGSPAVPAHTRLPLLLCWQVEEECCVTVAIAEPFYVTEVLPSASSAGPAAASAAITQYVLVHMLAAPLSAAQLQQIRRASDAMETRWLSISSVKGMEERATNSKAKKENAVIVADDNELIVPHITKVLDRAVLLYNRLFADSCDH